jgi:hypothetical protein
MFYLLCIAVSNSACVTAAVYIIGISGKKRTGKIMRKAREGYVIALERRLCQTRKR